MAPCPKRRHSHKRSTTRERSKNLIFPQLVYDTATGRKRLPHRPVKNPN